LDIGGSSCSGAAKGTILQLQSTVALIHFYPIKKQRRAAFITWKCRAIEGDKASKQVSRPSLKLSMLVHFSQHNSAYQCRVSRVFISPYFAHLIRSTK
jgi:hypothetical protein